MGRGGRDLESLHIQKTEHLLPDRIPSSGGVKTGSRNMTKPHQFWAFNLADTGN